MSSKVNGGPSLPATITSILLLVYALYSCAPAATQAQEREPAGHLTFVCHTDNAIDRAAAAAERGNWSILSRLHGSGVCAPSNAPLIKSFLTSERVLLKYRSETPKGTPFGVYRVETKRAFIFALVLHPESLGEAA